MLKVCVIDDEKALRKSLINKLHRLFPEQIEVAGEAGSIVEARALLSAATPELVFLDIELSDGLSFDIFNEQTPCDFEIIFITAHNQYAINAIKLGAVDYLLKPLADRELEESVGKFLKERVQQKQLKERIAVAAQQLRGLREERIVLRTANEYYIVYFENILFCKSDGGYTTFFLKDGGKIVVSKSIKEYELMLPASLFLRTHQSFLVNISCVTKLDKDGFLLLNGCTHKIPVSTRKKDEIVQRIFC